MAIMHWFKPKKIILNAYTSDTAIYDLAKITPSSREKPDWWNNLPKSNFSPETGENRTMRGCNGFNDLYAKGFTVKTPCDFYLKSTEEGLFQAHPKDLDLGGQHDLNQMGGNFFGENAFHYKLNPQWIMDAAKDINLLMTNHSWNTPQSTSRLFVPNGILNLKFVTDLNVNMILNPPEAGQNVRFDALMPIAMLIPLTEKRVEIKHHLLTKAEYEAKENGKMSNIFFVNNLSKVRKEKAKQEASKSCPFGFGKNQG